MYSSHGIIEPFLHLDSVNWTAVVHGDPASKVVADGVPNGLNVPIRFLAEESLPHLDLSFGVVLGNCCIVNSYKGNDFGLLAICSMHHNSGVANDGVTQDRMFYLSRFNTVTANLDLLIEATKEFDL